MSLSDEKLMNGKVGYGISSPIGFLLTNKCQERQNYGNKY